MRLRVHCLAIGCLALLLAGCDSEEAQLRRLRAEEESARANLRAAQEAADRHHVRCLEGDRDACYSRDTAAVRIPDAQLELDLARFRIEQLRR